MQNHITTDDIRNLGVTLNDEELEKLVAELNDKVDGMIGNEIITSLTPEDVDTLAEMQEKATDEEIGEWISEHIPDYEEIIEDNRNIVLGDFVDTSDLIDKDE
ncbi:MAG: hypothetical protein H6797_04795 [Candidatus Nomurabacteria bacterium]|nr:MAG: hypothetical protein H6797_04795 [Candidatus Nomurabacteria bacterium]